MAPRLRKTQADRGSHPKLPRAHRVELYTAIREMVEGAWPADRSPEVALCKEVAEVRVAVYRAGAACCNRYRRANSRLERLHLVYLNYLKGIKLKQRVKIVLL